jgi:hypothetical protein
VTCAKKPSSIVLMHDKGGNPDYRPFYEQMGQLSKEKTGVSFTQSPYPDTTTYQAAVRAAVPTDKAPDLFTWWSTYRMKELVDAGLLADLTDLWNKHPEFPQGRAVLHNPGAPGRRVRADRRHRGRLPSPRDGRAHGRLAPRHEPLQQRLRRRPHRHVPCRRDRMVPEQREGPAGQRGIVMNRKEYILHLIGEVAHFVLDGNPTKMVISLHQEEDGLHLAVFDDTPRTDEEIRAMQDSLGGGRRPELAGYYGGMAGFDLLGTGRLNLIGWQVKQADVSRVGDTTRINLWLGGERFDPGRFTIDDARRPPKGRTR